MIRNISLLKMRDISMFNAGSITVEASIILPFFISCVLLFITLLNFFFSYHTVKVSMRNTAAIMADYSYIYHEKVIVKLSDLLKEKTSFLTGDMVNKIVDKMFSEELKQNENIVNITESLKSCLSSYLNDEIDKADNQIYIPISKLIFEKYLSSLTDKEYENCCKSLNISSDINFSNSKFFDDGNDICLSLSYNYIINLPFFPSIKIPITQQIVLNGWLGGIGLRNSTDNEDNIWLLDNFERGRRIRKMYGANLPDNFPTISYYKDGNVKLIKSLDFTTQTYKQEGMIYKRVSNMIDTVKNYNGQNIPWGKDKITVPAENIVQKELILVIPENDMEDFQKKELDDAILKAKLENISLRVERMGHK